MSMYMPICVNICQYIYILECIFFYLFLLDQLIIQAFFFNKPIYIAKSFTPMANKFNRAAYLRNKNFQKQFNADSLEQTYHQEYKDSVGIIDEVVTNLHALMNSLATLKKIEENIIDSTYLNMEESFQKHQISHIYHHLHLSLQLIEKKQGGLFILRICKELSFWKEDFSFISDMITKIQQIFVNQTIGRLLFSASQIYQYAEKLLKFKIQNFQNLITEKLKYFKEEQRKKQKKKTLILNERLNEDEIDEKSGAYLLYYLQKYINTRINNSDIECFDIKNHYNGIIAPVDIIDKIVKLQIKRNKVFKKQINQYSKQFAQYQENKKVRLKAKQIWKQQIIKSISKGNLHPIKQSSQIHSTLYHSQPKPKKVIRLLPLQRNRRDNSQNTKLVRVSSENINHLGIEVSKTKDFKIKNKTYFNKQNINHKVKLKL